MTVYVPSLSSIIAKLLLVVERLLDEWVELDIHSWVVMDNTGPGALYGYVDNCAPHGNVTGSMTDCGNIMVEHLADIIQGAMLALNQILASLVTVQEMHTVSP